MLAWRSAQAKTSARHTIHPRVNFSFRTFSGAIADDRLGPRLRHERRHGTTPAPRSGQDALRDEHTADDNEPQIHEPRESLVSETPVEHAASEDAEKDAGKREDQIVSN